MVERATIFQNIQVGVQSSAGTGVAADKKLLALSIEPAVSLNFKKFRAMGNKYASLVIPQKEYVTAKLSGEQTYTELIYPFASVLNYAAPTLVGASLAYQWVFSPSTVAADTVKLFTVEQGSAVRAHKFIDGLVTSLELTFNRDGCEISGGEMIGAVLQDGISMTASPTSLALVPVLPTQIDLFLEDTYAALTGATALARALQATWAIRNRFGPVFPLATASGTGYAAVVETEPELELKLKMEADADGMALLTTARAGSKKFMRIKATGDNIEGAYDYDLQIDTAVEVSDVSDFTDEDGLFAIEWTLTGVHDSSWGKATEVTIVNDVDAL